MRSLSIPLVFAGTLRKLFMTIGALLFIALGAHTLSTAGSPQAARSVSDVQPEIHTDPLLVVR